MHFLSVIPALLLASTLPCAAFAATPQAGSATPAVDLSSFQFEPAVPWLSAGDGMSNNHFASSEFILGRYTLPYVSQRWVFSAKDEVRATPTIEKNRVYLADNSGTVYQLDAVTGKPIWEASLPTISGDPQSSSNNSPAIGTNNVIVGDQDSATLYGLKKADGSLAWKTVLDTAPGAIVTSSAVVVNGRVYVGVASMQEQLASTKPGFVPSFRGSVVALDENTGQILWQTHVVPVGYTGGAVWESNIAVDPARDTLYVTTGNNYSVPPSVAACQAAGTTPAQLDACLSPDDHIDSVLSMNMDTGAIGWSQRFTDADTWTVSCDPYSTDRATPCPNSSSLDTDFGAGANLFTVNKNGTEIDAVGAGQKSGAYFAMNRDTGEILWGTQTGPDGVVGGIQFGAATDNQRIYVPNGNSLYVDTTLIPSGVKTNGGFWSALDKNTGKILWQTPTLAPSVVPVDKSPRAGTPPPNTRALVEGSVTIANGVLYGEDVAGNFVALDAATGAPLRYFQSGGAAVSGPAIVDGVLYWSSGASGYGATNNQVYAFWIGLQ